MTVRVQSVRHFSVSQMALLVENTNLLLATNSTQRNNICEVLLAAAWICGEYAEYVARRGEARGDEANLRAADTCDTFRVSSRRC